MKKARLMFTLLTLVFLIGLVFVSAGVSSPGLPHLFYGTSQVDGGDTPEGTVIIAKVDGEEKGRFTTAETGSYGADSGKKLVVQGDISGEADIEFYISTIKADQTAFFDSGEIEELDLTWEFPDEIFFEGDLIDEPILCMPGTDIEIDNDGLSITVTCSESSTANINDISELGTDFFIGAPSESGVEELSTVFEISVTGDVEIIVTMSYDDTGIDESTVRPYKYDGDSWVAVPDEDIISRDTTANTIKFRISPGGTPYTVFGSEPEPEVAPSSGGGSGSINVGGRRCTYAWQCDEWSPCSEEGTQIRTCTNQGTCKGTLDKPDEIQNCVFLPLEIEEKEPVGVEEIEIEEEESTTIGFLGITGGAIQNMFRGIFNPIVITTIFAIVLLSIGFYFMSFWWKK